MTNEDLIQGLKEQRVKSMARWTKLLEKACKAEPQDLADLLDEIGDEEALGQRIEHQIQNLGGLI